MTFQPNHFTVWSEIPVTDLEKAMAFYSAVFQINLEVTEQEPNPTVMLPTKEGMGVAGHLYPGKPATDGTGPTVHFACPDTVEKTLERVEAAGGKVLSPAIPIPVGRFAYFNDPDGNSLGVFEYAADHTVTA